MHAFNMCAHESNMHAHTQSFPTVIKTSFKSKIHKIGPYINLGLSSDVVIGEQGLEL